MNTGPTTKLTRWIEKRERFTRREAFLATKGGSIRNIADFDAALCALVDKGLVALASNQPARGTAFVVGSTRAVLTADSLCKLAKIWSRLS